jgi:hypothetical protein
MEKIVENFRDKIVNPLNSTMAFEKFIFALKEKDNRLIENTIIYQALELLLEKNETGFKKTIPQGEIFYRARKVNPSGVFPTKEKGFSIVGNKLCGFDSYNSKESPIGLSPEGRNNVQGQSYLYLAEDAFTACAEVKPNAGEVISVAKFRLIKPINVVDFRNNESVASLKVFAEKNQINASKLITLIMQEYCMRAYKEDSYLMTQYVSDYIRKKRYDGVKFLSSQTDKFNLTLFNCDSSIIKWEDSSVFYCPDVIPQIYDLETAEYITPGKKILTSKDCMEVKKQIINQIK